MVTELHTCIHVNLICRWLRDVIAGIPYSKKSKKTSESEVGRLGIIDILQNKEDLGSGSIK